MTRRMIAMNTSLILSLSKDEGLVPSADLMLRQAQHEGSLFFALPLEGGGRGGGERRAVARRRSATAVR